MRFERRSCRYPGWRSRRSPLRRQVIAAGLVLCAALLVSCGGGATDPPDRAPAEEAPREAAEVSIRELKGPDAERFIGEAVRVEGVFVGDPVPMLVSDLELVLVNMPIPEPDYIPLIGSRAEEMDASEFGGAFIAAEGILRVQPNLTDYWLEVVSIDMIDRLEPYDPQIADIAEVAAGPPDPTRYAILFSGGIKKEKNHTRYWNDLKFMHSTLVGAGFDKDNIAVLYGDGKALDKTMKVDYAGTEANLAAVLGLLEDTSTDRDLVFIFTTNHGGGFYEADPTPHGYGGALDANGDEGPESISEKKHKIDFDGDGETNDFVAWDEVLYGWGQGDEISDDALAGMLADVEAEHLVLVMEQCFSGGFIRDIGLGAQDWVVITAAHQYETSEAMPPDYDYDEFSFHFTSALNGAEPNGDKVDADSNDDGHVSLTEAFNYAQSNDTRPETPQYEDSGDGVSHSGNMPASGDGEVGAGIHF